MICLSISRPKTANYFAKARAILGGITQLPGNVARSHGITILTTILRVKFAAILALPSLIGSNTSLKVAPFGRWTPQKRGAL